MRFHSMVRRLCTKFQVNTVIKTYDRQMTDKQTERDHIVIEIQAMIYDVARIRRLCTKFQVNTSKNKNFHFGW